MSDVAGLNAQYGVEGRIEVVGGAGGMTAVKLRNARGSAEVMLQGAHVTQWSPAGAKPVIWLSPAAKFAPGKSIRGGVPICWPWFGPHGSESTYPAHGFARTVPWEIVASGSEGDTDVVRLRLLDSEITRAQWARPSELTLEIRVGADLELTLTTRNIGKFPLTVGEALHTYFAVGDVRQARVHGLDGLSYIDKVGGFTTKHQQGAVTIDGEVDRIYLDSSDDCTIDDPAWKRRIRIAKRESRSTVVWNPGAAKAQQMGDFGGPDGHLGMLCVESGNAADNVVSIEPSASHSLWVRYSVEAL